MSLARSRSGQDEAVPTQIINASSDETLCPHFTHSVPQVTSTVAPTIITRAITLEGNLGSLNIEGNVGAVTLD